MDAVVRSFIGAAAFGVLGYGAYRDRKQLAATNALKELAREVTNQIHTTPIFLVVGMKHHGKSSLINSIFRVVYNETGSFIRRAETGPISAHETTTHFKLHYVHDEKDGTLFALVDSPPLGLSGNPEVEDLKEALQALKLSTTAASTSNGSSSSIVFPNVVLVVVSAKELANGKDLLAALQSMTRTIREHDLRFVMIITFKLGIPVGNKSRLVKEVSTSCGTESVYCLENYVQEPNCSSAAPLERNFETENTLLHVLRQCLEFCR